MSCDDLKSHATSDIDFYELLDVNFETSQKNIDRAWRRTALKYHPDHRGNDPVAKEKFHLAQIGYDLLSDPSSKAIYDNARSARLQRKRQNELFEGRRRQMKDDLEARERGVKRSRDEEEREEEKLEREIRRLAEDGKRRRKEREEALRREMQEDIRSTHGAVDSPGSTAAIGNASMPAKSNMSELDRTVKVRWPVKGEGGSATAEGVKSLFSTFGEIDSADMLNPKMIRLGKKQEKQMAVICMIQYASVVGAHAAVEDFARQEGPEWRIFDSVFWAANKEPDFLNRSRFQEIPTDSAPSTPFSKSRSATPLSAIASELNIPAGTPQPNGDSPRKKPSFASFSSAAVSTPTNSPFGRGFGGSSPSLEELTMIRLKTAEKKRQKVEKMQLTAEIQCQDEAADAAAVPYSMTP